MSVVVLDLEDDFIGVLDCAVGAVLVPSLATNGFTALPPLACEKSQLKLSAWLWYEIDSLGSFELSASPDRADQIQEALEFWKLCNGVSCAPLIQPGRYLPSILPPKCCSCYI